MRIDGEFCRPNSADDKDFSFLKRAGVDFGQIYHHKSSSLSRATTILREDSMELSNRHHHSRRVMDNRFKSFSSDPTPQKYSRVVRTDAQYDRDDRSARSDTPPSCPAMTLCSSTSASSSITACDHAADAGQCHACQNLSDVESYAYQNSDTDSPRTHPAVILGHSSEGKLWAGELTVKRLGYEKNVLRSIPPRFPLDYKSLSVDDGFVQDSRPKAISDSVQSKVRSNPVPGNGTSGGSRQSQLVLRRNVIVDEISESDVGDDENEEDEEDEEDENDWSGQDDNLEARLIEALGHDLPLAAYLIPLLYKVFRSEVSAKITRTVGPWCQDVTKCAGDKGTSGGKSSSSNAAQNTSNMSSNDARKRSRGLDSMSHDHEPEEEEEDDEDEGDDKRDPKRTKNHPESGGPAPHPRLACPFYKLDPSKYGVQHDAVDSGKKTDFRVCAGPGFKSITRLKEHLKRKHYPVQCERCYCIFEGGPDRAVRARDLESHRQLPNPCERGDSSLKEGISDAQWASLDRNRKNQGSPNIEKWNEIWAILFPDKNCPKTPWYDQTLSEIPSPPPSEGCSQFLELFKAILDHKIGQQHIHLEEGMHARVVTAVQVAFETWYRTFRSDRGLSSTDSSSALQTSYLESSWQQVSPSGPSGTHRLSSHSQAYSMDIVGSPTGSSMMKPRRSQRDSAVQGMDPRFMAQAAAHYAPSAIGPGMATAHRSHNPYPVDLPTGMDSFAGPFNNSHMESGTDPYFAMDYDTPGVAFDDGNAAASAAYANQTGGINPQQTFINSPGNATHHNLAAYPQNSWSHPYPGTGRPHYTSGRP